MLTPLLACIPLCDTLAALMMLAIVYLAARVMTKDEEPAEAAAAPSGPAALPASAYQPGERVRIIAGPFRGMEALVDRINPAANLVLLHLEAYGRSIQVGEPAERVERIG